MKKKGIILSAVLILLACNLFFFHQFIRYKRGFQQSSKQAQQAASAYIDILAKMEAMQTNMERFRFLEFVEFANRSKSPAFHKILKSTFRYSRKYNLSPYLVLSVIYQESGFNPVATSGKGACGLMQINYPVWKEYLGLKFMRIYEVDYNIEYGCRILKQYLDEAGGNVAQALYLYNNGYLENGNINYPIMVLSGKFALKSLSSAG